MHKNLFTKSDDWLLCGKHFYRDGLFHENHKYWRMTPKLFTLKTNDYIVVRISLCLVRTAALTTFSSGSGVLLPLCGNSVYVSFQLVRVQQHAHPEIQCFPMRDIPLSNVVITGGS